MEGCTKLKEEVYYRKRESERVGRGREKGQRCEEYVEASRQTGTMVRARPKCGPRRGRAVDIEFIGCRVATVHALSLSTHPRVLLSQRARRFAGDFGYSICYAPRTTAHRVVLKVRRIGRSRLPISSHVRQKGVERFA